MKKICLCFVLMLFVVSVSSQTPTFQWANNISGSTYDYGNAVTTDTTDNVYVTGSFYGPVDFDPSAATFTLNAASNNAFIAKYSSTGSLLWAKKLAGKISSNGSTITYDKLGFIYVAGIFADTVDFDPSASTYTLVASGNVDAFISKYDLSGNFIWAKKVGGTQQDDCRSISTSISGDVYITGTFAGTADFDPSASSYPLTSSGSDDIYILKLSSLGNFVWAKKVGSFYQDIANSITVDPLGFVHVVGLFQGTVDFDPNAGVYNLFSVSNTNQNTFILKLDAIGNFVFAESFEGSYSNKGTSVTVDLQSNIYITGGYSGIVDFDPSPNTYNLTASNTLYSCYIVKLDKFGSLLFAKSIDNPGSSGSLGTSISVDNKKSIYVYGGYSYIYNDFDPGPGTYTITCNGQNDIFILKLDSTGMFSWIKNFGGTGYDYSTSMSISKFGGIYTTGYYSNTVDFNTDAGTYNLTAVNYDGFVHKMLEGITIGVEETKTNSLLSIYPNPTNSLLTINSKTELQKIEIISVDGKVLLNEVPTNITHTLHLDNFANGIYFVNLYQNDRVVKREKIVLNK